MHAGFTAIYAQDKHVAANSLPRTEAHRRLIPGGHDPLEQQQPAVLGDHLPGVPQRKDSSIIVPANKEICENIGIATAGNRLKRIPSNEPAAIDEAVGL